MAMGLYFAKQAGLRSRIVRVKLNNSSVKTEAGALYYSKGNLVSDAKMGGVGGFFKKGISGALTSESLVKPSYKVLFQMLKWEVLEVSSKKVSLAH